MIQQDYRSASAHGQPVGSSGRPRHTVASLVRSLPKRCRTVTDLRWRVLATGLAVLVIGWSVAIVTIPGARFAVTAPVAQAGVEAASALARLFAALVLFLFPTERAGPRLHWVAGGLVVLGLGDLVFGYLPTLLGAHASLNTSIYEWLGVRTAAGVLFAVGLILRTPPTFTRRLMALTLALFAALGALAMTLGNAAPALVHIGNLAVVAARGEVLAQGFTLWYWVLSAIPLMLAALTVLGAAHEVRAGTAGGWLVVGMVLLAGAQLHNMFWPSVYSPVLTTADLLRLAFAIVVTIGGIVELRAIAARRAALLAAEQEQSRRLAELGVLKANFTAMVAHELGSPLAAIRRVADLLDSGQLDQRHALDTIWSETDMLATLVDDMQTAGAVERADFATQPRLVPLNVLLADAAAFARTLPGDHPLSTAIETYARVVADPERISQVLRNLLGNAAKYAPPGAPIELRAVRRGEYVRIEVADQGFGIHPDDLPRIFEKFGRGRDQGGRRVAGAGLGLYLSRRIVQAHGSELTVESTPGVGSVFGFDLPVTPSVGGEAVGDRAAIHVLIVDDHTSFRQPLSMLLEQEPQISVVGQAGTLAEARQMLQGVDVALLDLDLPDGSGIDLIEEISAAHARTVILTASKERQDIAQAVEAGATAVVHKSAHIEEITQAVQQVARGASLVQHKDVLELLHDVRREREREREAQAALAQLTPREREVLQALSEGLSDKEIAQQLYVSVATARTHVVRTLGKLGVHSRLQAVIFAASHGAIEIREPGQAARQ